MACRGPRSEEEWDNLLSTAKSSKHSSRRKDSPYPEVNVQLVISADRAGVPSNFIFTL